MILSLLFSTFCAFAESSKLSGTPKFIRGNPQTEVFFKDLKDSFIIPNNDSHNRILNVFVEALKSGKPVQFNGDAKLRVIYDIATEANTASTAPAAPSATHASPSVVPGASPKPVFKEINN